jgi:hypothetical protein
MSARRKQVNSSGVIVSGSTPTPRG